MKKILSAFIAIVALACFGGCSTKFNIAAPYKNITVIYGFLDEADTAHYIRVLKAFLSQNLSALTMAQTPDSSYYASLNVKIERINPIDTSVHDTIHLNRVDMDKEGYQKMAGTFYTAPNYAYKFTNPLDPTYFYRIVVTNLSTGQVDSADAPVLDDSYDGTFDVSAIDTNATGLPPVMDFSSTVHNAFYEIQAGYNVPANYNFYGQSTPVAVAQAILTFNWMDSSITSHKLTPQSFQYNAGYYLVTATGGIDYQINDLALYEAISGGMGTAPTGIIRLMGHCQIAMYLGTPDYYNYYQSSIIQGTGLTGDDIEPVFTNIKGPAALGLYTSRAIRSGYVTLTNSTIDSLEISPITQNVNIQGTDY